MSAAVVRYRNLGWNHNQQMDMVRLNIHFHDLYFLLLGERPYAVSYFMANISGQNAMTVLGNPYNMVLAVPNGV
jgi:hypothetical protein